MAEPTNPPSSDFICNDVNLPQVPSTILHLPRRHEYGDPWPDRTDGEVRDARRETRPSKNDHGQSNELSFMIESERNVWGLG